MRAILRAMVVVVLACGLAAGLSAATAGAASSSSYDLLVRVTADASAVPVNSTDGYTVSISNTTEADIAVGALRFLLPGHGGSAIAGDVYGSPHESSDTTPAFTYLTGSASGLTSDDPSSTDRWLTWPGFTVPAASTVTLHFGVKVSSAPAYYVVGATVDAEGATVQGTVKGAQVRVVDASLFSLSLSASPTRVPVGGLVTYQGTLTNNADTPVVVNKVKVAATATAYVVGSSGGALSVEPTKVRTAYFWNQSIDVSPHSSTGFTFQLRTTATGSHAVQGRASLSQPLPDGQAYAGTGPTARIQVFAQTMTLSSDPASLPGGVQGNVYPDSRLVAAGGSAPYGFTLTEGALPNGLTLSSDGTVSGTPTEAGRFTFEVTATDAYGASTSAMFSIDVAAETVTLGFDPTPVPDGAVGVAYSGAVTADGGLAPYSFALAGGALPDGLSLSSDGTVSGTPTMEGVYTFDVAATDAYGVVGTGSFTITVGGPDGA